MLSTPSLRAINIIFIPLSFLTISFVFFATFYSPFYNNASVVFWSGLACLMITHFLLYKFKAYYSKITILFVHSCHFIIIGVSFVIALYYFSKMGVWGLQKTNGAEDFISKYDMALFGLGTVLFMFGIWFLTRKLLLSRIAPS